MSQDVDCVARAYCKSGYLVLQRQLNRLIRGTYLQLAKRVSMHQQKVMLIRLNGQVILARILYLIIYLQKLDYASSHLWTDNWNLFSLWNRKWVEDGSLNFSKTWIEEHSKDSLNILQNLRA